MARRRTRSPRGARASRSISRPGTTRSTAPWTAIATGHGGHARRLLAIRGLRPPPPRPPAGHRGLPAARRRAGARRLRPEHLASRRSKRRSVTAGSLSGRSSPRAHAYPSRSRGRSRRDRAREPRAAVHVSEVGGRRTSSIRAGSSGARTGSTATISTGCGASLRPFPRRPSRSSRTGCSTWRPGRRPAMPPTTSRFSAPTGSCFAGDAAGVRIAPSPTSPQSRPAGHRRGRVAAHDRRDRSLSSRAALPASLRRGRPHGARHRGGSASGPGQAACGTAPTRRHSCRQPKPSSPRRCRRRSAPRIPRRGRSGSPTQGSRATGPEEGRQLAMWLRCNRMRRPGSWGSRLRSCSPGSRCPRPRMRSIGASSPDSTAPIQVAAPDCGCPASRSTSLERRAWSSGVPGRPQHRPRHPGRFRERRARPSVGRLRPGPLHVRLLHGPKRRRSRRPVPAGNRCAIAEEARASCSWNRAGLSRTTTAARCASATGTSTSASATAATAATQARRAQNPSTRLGKLLWRNNGHWEILFYGLRNPWRWSFDRASGDLYIGDVGQDRGRSTPCRPRRCPRRENFGWDRCEGTLGTRVRTRACAAPASSSSPFQYAQSGGGLTGNSVIGGVYRGSNMARAAGPLLLRRSGRMGAERRPRTLNDRRNPGFSVPTLVSFGENSKGELCRVAERPGLLARS